MKKITKAVILCGGMATRFLPVSKGIPKEMMPILDKPILHLILEKLKQAGITETLIIVGRGKESILNYFDKDVELETTLVERGKNDLLTVAKSPTNLMDISYKRQYEPLGTGYSLKFAKSFVGDEPFIFTFGDEFIYEENENYFEELMKVSMLLEQSVIAVQRVEKEDLSKYGIIKFKQKTDDVLMVEGIVEKPKIEDAPSDFSYIGTAVLTSEIFDILEGFKVVKNKEFGVTDAYEILAKKESLFAKKINGTRYDLGNKLGFLKANIMQGLHDEIIGKEVRKYLKILTEKN